MDRQTRLLNPPLWTVHVPAMMNIACLIDRQDQASEPTPADDARAAMMILPA
jgi:hypothetical protein